MLHITIDGNGCEVCNTAYQDIKDLVEELGLNAEVKMENDPEKTGYLYILDPENLHTIVFPVNGSNKEDFRRVLSGVTVEILLFHPNKECKKCDAIKKYTKKAYEDNYYACCLCKTPFSYKIIDYSQEENLELKEKYGIEHTSVILVKHLADGTDIVDDLGMMPIELAPTDPDEYMKQLCDRITGLWNSDSKDELESRLNQKKSLGHSKTYHPGEIMTLTDEVVYSENSIQSKEILRNSAGTVTLFAFDKGEELSPHSAPYDVLLQVIEGKATITLEDRKNVLSAGQAIILPANVMHAVYATEKFKMLLTMLKK